MSVNKELVKGSTSMLVLGVLEEKEMYGYQIIKELEQRSETVFSLKEGTLYPILHVLEQDGFLSVQLFSPLFCNPIEAAFSR